MFRERKFAPAHYAAFVLLGGDHPSVHASDLGSAEAIDDKVAQVSQFQSRDEAMTLPTQQEATDTTHAAVQLRRMIWDPLAKLIPSTGRVYVSPAGSLSAIPFEALPLEHLHPTHSAFA
jgi:hypothetical protein